MKKLSVIIPCYNEEENIEPFYKVISQTLKDIDYELVYINDGSTDQTLPRLKNIYTKDKNVKIISFSRNFKKDSAIYAGLKNAKASYYAIIDSDLQQHPKYILEALNFLENNSNYDQVALVNKYRQEKILSKLVKKIWYKFINFLSDTNFIESASDFRVFNDNVAQAILSLPENSRFSKGIFSWVGFNTYPMEYQVLKRLSGQSKFNLKNNLSYGLEGIISFSTKPLRIATYTGIVASIISFILLIEVLIEKIFFHTPIAGYPTIMCAILFIGGIQLITVGILGEYLAKTYYESKKRPAYIIKEKYGIND